MTEAEVEAHGVKILRRGTTWQFGVIWGDTWLPIGYLLYQIPLPNPYPSLFFLSSTIPSSTHHRRPTAFSPHPQRRWPRFFLHVKFHHRHISPPPPPQQPLLQNPTANASASPLENEEQALVLRDQASSLATRGALDVENGGGGIGSSRKQVPALHHIKLERVDGASVRRDDVFAIRKLEIGGPIGLDPGLEGVRAGFTRFSMSDLPPHS